MAKQAAFDYNAKTTELDMVLVKLQDADTPLDEAMKLHETGKALVKELETFLQHAENEIETALKSKG